MVPSIAAHTPCAVEQSMNDHGGLTLSEMASNRTYQVVEYATPEVRKALSLAADGTTVEVRLEPLGARGDAWRAVGVGTTDSLPAVFKQTVKQ